MSASVNRNHTFSFSIQGVPTIDQLQAELEHAKSVMDGSATVRMKSFDDQRDGYSLNVTITGRPS